MHATRGGEGGEHKDARKRRGGEEPKRLKGGRLTGGGMKEVREAQARVIKVL